MRYHETNEKRNLNMGYKNTSNHIEALKVALTDKQVKRVVYQGKLLFVKVTLPDGRTA